MGKCDADSGILFSACLRVSQSFRSYARCCDAGSRVVSPACARCCDAGCLPLVSLCPSLCGQMPDAVTLALGSCLPLVFLPVSAVWGRVSRLSPCVPVSPVRCQMLRRWLRGRVFRLSPCVSQSLRSECCDACSGVVSPACLFVSPSLCGQVSVSDAGSCLPCLSFCGRMPDAATLARGCVSRLSPCVWMPNAVTLAPGLCLPHVELASREASISGLQDSKAS